ncbi:M67 family metallopeptidase [Sphingomonas sp. RS2018]
MLRAISAEAAASPKREVCGLLYGGGDGIDAASACANVDGSPETAFEIDPATLIAAYRRERAGGPRIVGCYHSHPGGRPVPSLRDAAAAAADGWLWLIAGGGRIEAYRAVPDGAIHGRFEPVGLIERPDEVPKVP